MPIKTEKKALPVAGSIYAYAEKLVKSRIKKNVKITKKHPMNYIIYQIKTLKNPYEVHVTYFFNRYKDFVCNSITLSVRYFDV